MQLQPEGAKPYDEINITPMLDLAYVLLIIFIVMTTASVQGIRVNLPKASAAPSLAQSNTKAITITKEGAIFLDTVPVSLQELEQRLVQQKALTPDFPVVVRSDGEGHVQPLIEVFDMLQSKVGITQIALATKRLTN